MAIKKIKIGNEEHELQTTIDNVDGLQSTLDTIDAKLDYTNIAYGTCSTAAETAAKVITISGNTQWALANGSVIMVLFSNSNTASSVTLNVNGTGAYPIWYNNAEYTSNGTAYTGYANRVTTYMFNGTHWVWIASSYDSNTTYTNVKLGHGYATCSTAASTAAKVGKLSSYTLTTGGIVAVKFTYAVPANATLNINDKGAKAIYYRGAKITANVIQAGDIATFIYNGSYYHLLAIDRWQNDFETTLASAKSYTDTKVANLINGAPTTLDTLKEIADAMQTNADVVDALEDAIGNKVDKVSGKGLSTNDYTTTEKNKLATIESGANAYNHPHFAQGPDFGEDILGLWKFKVEEDGHFSNAEVVTKEDIVALGIPASDTTYSEATTSTAGLMSASDKQKLNGIRQYASSAVFSRSLSSGRKIGTITINGSDTDIYAPTSDLVVGASTVDIADAETFLTNGNVYLNHVENGVVNNNHRIIGDHGILVTGSMGDIFITGSNATTSKKGMMSEDDKKKLNSIAEGAQVNQNAFTRVEVNGTGYDASSNSASTMQLISSDGIELSISNKDNDADITIKNTGVTGLKGDSESTYRTGNINITPSDIGASPSYHTHSYNIADIVSINAPWEIIDGENAEDLFLNIDSQLSSLQNHTHTKANIGLDKVDNTSDMNKPVSAAQQAAIDTALNSAKTYTDIKAVTVDSSLSTSSANPVQNQTITNWLAENVKNYRLAVGNSGSTSAYAYLTSDEINVAAGANDTASAIYLLRDDANNEYCFGTFWEFIKDIPTINGKALSSNITLTASDVGAYTTAEVDAALEDAKVLCVNIAGMQDENLLADKNVIEIQEAVDAGRTVVFVLPSEAIGGDGGVLLAPLLGIQDEAAMFVINVGTAALQINVDTTNCVWLDMVEISESIIGEANAYTDEQINTSLSNYYTKSQIDSLELISTSDIDTICGTTIQVASAEGVTF